LPVIINHPSMSAQATSYILIVDIPQQGVLRLELQDSQGTPIDTLETSYEGHVDNVLLTSVDNLIQRNTIAKSALRAVHVGAGIDKNSSLYRIVIAFASAISAAS
jgi:hypothetical protein